MKMKLTTIFFLFEKVAKDLDWPLNKYTIFLQSVLKVTASEVYLALKPELTSRICHELTVEIKFGELNNVFQDEFHKILSQVNKCQILFIT